MNPVPTSSYFWDRPCIEPRNACAFSQEPCAETAWWFWILAGGLAAVSLFAKKGRA